MSAVISLRVDDALYNRINSISKQSGIDKTKFIREAISNYMDDKEDYFIALQALNELKNGLDGIISWEQLQKDLDL